MNNFNAIAPYYDQIVHWVYGGRVRQAEQVYLNRISRADRILIVGGGNGQILESIAQQTLLPVQIDYIDSSHCMINNAKKRIKKNGLLKVNFYQVEFQNFDSNYKYDVVILSFFLDCFTFSSLRNHIEHVKCLLHNHGHLVVTDFQILNRSWWQTTLVALMHILLQCVGRLESHTLLPIEFILQQANFEKISTHTFFRRFIFSSLYRKSYRL